MAKSKHGEFVNSSDENLLVSSSKRKKKVTSQKDDSLHTPEKRHLPFKDSDFTVMEAKDSWNRFKEKYVNKSVFIKSE